VSVLSRIAAAFRPEHSRPAVIANDQVRTQVAILKEEAEETIRMIDRHTGIWHQDMIEGVYQGESTPRAHRHE
jgi:hypothetical protein